MSAQNPLTLVTPIREERLSDLYSYLSKIKYQLEAGQHELFELTQNIHYLRWVIIDDNTSVFFEGKPHAPKLVFSSNFDGKVEQHLKDLCGDFESKLIDTIYSCCEEYPDTRDRTPWTRSSYLKKHMVKTSAFYIGGPGRSVVQIINENQLRICLRSLLDSKDWKNKTQAEIHDYLKEAVTSNPDFSWLKEPYKMPRTNWFRMVLLAVVLFLLFPFIFFWVLLVQYGYERKDEYFTRTRSGLDEKKIKILEEYEDLIVHREDKVPAHGDKELLFYQNQFTQLVDMKPGWVRLVTFKGMMLFARTLISNFFVKGELMGIPTIHFARWVLFDDNKRVLFFSNFDGSWQQYLGDFIDQSGWGLTGIFSNTKVFPRTRFLGLTGVFSKKKFIYKNKFLFPGGAYDEEHFLAWSRNSELSTQIWYSAYPELSIKNINNNSRIRVLISKSPSKKELVNFFELI